MKLKLTNNITTIIGKKGTGKTSRVKELLIAGNYDQAFILDYLYEYDLYATDKVCVSTSANDVEAFCKDLWSKCRTNIKSVVVFDEIALYGSNNFDIDFLYRAGRHANLDIIATSQRFFKIPLIVRSQTDMFNVFQITEPRDIDYLNRTINKSIVDTIINLKVLQYVEVKI